MSKGNLDPKSQKSQSSAVAPTAAVAPAKRLAFFGPPPLIKGEDTAAYDALLAKVSTTVKPVDIIEEIFVRDIVDLVWEALRMRRLKAALMTQRSANLPYSSSRLDSSLLEDDALMAETLAVNIDYIERIDRLTALAEARRIAALHEIDRHRATLADGLRRTVQQVEDAEYKVIETQSVNENTAA